MPYLVNGQIVSDEIIRQEKDRIARDPSWQSITDETERAQRLQQAAEWCAVDRVIIEQLAVLDTRPIDPAIFERDLQRAKSQAGCRPDVDDTVLRKLLEDHLRVERFRKELVADAVKPTDAEMEELYSTNREKFRQPELFRAAHIVKHVRKAEEVDDALATMQVALTELEQGADFGDVARRHSDCPDNGGDLGEFLPKNMVPEFEQAIRGLEPGQRSAIFPSPYGFHIALLITHTPEGIAPLERVRPDIERVMLFGRQHEIYTRKMAELRSQADIRWVPQAANAA